MLSTYCRVLLQVQNDLVVPICFGRIQFVLAVQTILEVVWTNQNEFDPFKTNWTKQNRRTRHVFLTVWAERAVFGSTENHTFENFFHVFIRKTSMKLKCLQIVPSALR